MFLLAGVCFLFVIPVALFLKGSVDRNAPKPDLH
jgi:hypothetical protein